MSAYRAPLRDIRFVLRELVGIDHIASLPGCLSVSGELVDAVLEQAGRFAADVLAPLNQPGDQQGCTLHDGTVTTPAGFRDAYARFIADGWTTLSCDPVSGGQGLPGVLAAAIGEMWDSANVSFALCPLLTRAAIEALSLAGTEAQKQTYLPRLVSGAWAGTMNLTEPQAGSDLSAVRTRAVPDGTHYRVYGTKIYITYGEHDLTENIVHLVLARLPDAPDGVKGISLFVVPKFLPNADGSLGVRNDIRCVSIEHKLGIRASPTAVLAFGDSDGAIGELVGEAHRGLEYMFVMMNLARFGVGLEGIGISERAWQRARDFAQERVQGTEAGMRGAARVPIIRHPDVRRMLLEMKARIEAMRALAYVVAAALDIASRHADAAARVEAQAFADLMIPVLKGWCTEQSVVIASIGVQVHGGMGYIEETGAAQHLRDARITTIYEGTTGIQANDLIGRKLLRDRGRAAHTLLSRMRQTQAALAESDGAGLRAIGTGLGQAIDAVRDALDHVLTANDARSVAAIAVPMLHLLGTVAGGWQMGRAALAASALLATDSEFHTAKLATVRFYFAHVLPHAQGLRDTVLYGAPSVLAASDAQLALY